MLFLYVFGYNDCCFSLEKDVLFGKLHCRSAIIIKKCTLTVQFNNDNWIESFQQIFDFYNFGLLFNRSASHFYNFAPEFIIGHRPAPEDVFNSRYPYTLLWP